MTPVRSVRAATAEDLGKRSGRGSKYDSTVSEINNVFNQGQDAIVAVELAEGETEIQYRTGISLTLKRKGVEKVTISKIESDEDKKNLTFRISKVGKEGE